MPGFGELPEDSTNPITSSSTGETFGEGGAAVIVMGASSPPLPPHIPSSFQGEAGFMSLMATTLLQPLVTGMKAGKPASSSFSSSTSTMVAASAGATVEDLVKEINDLLNAAGLFPITRKSPSGMLILRLTPTSSHHRSVSPFEAVFNVPTTTTTTGNKANNNTNIYWLGQQSGEVQVSQFLKGISSPTEDPEIFFQVVLRNTLYRYQSALFRRKGGYFNIIANNSAGGEDSGNDAYSDSLPTISGLAPLAAYQRFTEHSSVFLIPKWKRDAMAMVVGGSNVEDEELGGVSAVCRDVFLPSRWAASQVEYRTLIALEARTKAEFEPFAVLPPLNSQTEILSAPPPRASYRMLATNFAFQPLSKVLNNRLMSSDLEADISVAGRLLEYLQTPGNTELVINGTNIVNTKQKWSSLRPQSSTLFTRRTLVTTTTTDGVDKDVSRAYRIRNCPATTKLLPVVGGIDAAGRQESSQLKGPSLYQSPRGSVGGKGASAVVTEPHPSSGIRPHLLPTMSDVTSAYPLPVMKGCPAMTTHLRPDAFCSPNLGRDWSSKSLMPLVNKTLPKSQRLLRAAHILASDTPLDDQYIPEETVRANNLRRSTGSPLDPYFSKKASSSIVFPISYALASSMYDNGVRVVEVLEAAAAKVLGSPIYVDFEQEYGTSPIPTATAGVNTRGNNYTKSDLQDLFVKWALSESTTTSSASPTSATAQTAAAFSGFLKRDDVSQVKDKPCADIVPKDKASYRFSNEGEYVREYGRSLFCITFKKGGWDVLRHYEIISSGCMPFMLDVDSIPAYTMYTYPKAIVFAARDLPGVTFDCEEMRVRVDFTIFPMLTYIKLLRALMDHAKRFLTTKALAQYVLESSGHHNARKVLFVADYRHDLPLRAMGNYNSWMLYHGMKELLGPLNVVESTRLPFLFNQGSEGAQGRVRDRLYGKGFGYAFKLPGEYGNEAAEETHGGGHQSVPSTTGPTNVGGGGDTSRIDKHKGKVIDIENELGGAVAGGGGSTPSSPDKMSSNTPVRGRIFQRILEREFDVIIYPDVIATTLKKQRSNLRYLANIKRAGYTKKDVLFIHGPDIPYSPPRILGYYLDFLYANGIVFQREIADCERYLPPGDVLPGISPSRAAAAAKASMDPSISDLSNKKKEEEDEERELSTSVGASSEVKLYEDAQGTDPRLPLSRGDILKMCVWYRTRNCFDDVNIISNSATKRLSVGQLLSPVSPIPPSP